MIYARQSTAIIVTVGPVLSADGTAVTDCVVGDFKISKNGGSPAALNASATLTHRNTGHYSLSLTATDVNTVGSAEIVIDDTTNACAIKEITVLSSAIYDVMFGASATFNANIVQVGGSTMAADGLESAFQTGNPFPANFNVLHVSDFGLVNANIVQVNEIGVDGSGTESDPWGPV